MTYQQFSIEEREKIQEMLWAKSSIRAIARELKRSPSSVSREIERNRPPVNNHYAPRLANERALAHRKKRGREERLKSDALRSYVISHLKLGWSPETAMIRWCGYEDARAKLLQIFNREYP